MKSNGGGCNAILARELVAEYRSLRLRTWPERRVAQLARLREGVCLVNFHASADPQLAARELERLSLEALVWAGDAPLILGGDLNLRSPGTIAGKLVHVGQRDVDHLFVRGLAPVGFVLTLVALPFAVLAGSWWIAVSVGGGVVLHELAHSIALYGVPRALVLDGLRPSVLHPRVGTVRTVVVGAAGPLGPSLVALLLVVFARSAGPASAPLAAHALGLTVLAPDGRNACGLS